MTFPPYTGIGGKIGHYSYIIFCGFVFLFLIAPILVIIPLSFNAEPYFTFTEGMISMKSDAYSTRWYADIAKNPQWAFSAVNSIIVAVCSTLLATFLGTLAALGLSQSHMPYKSAVMGVLISPMIVPLIISAAGMFFFYSNIGLAQTLPGLILAHAVLGTPFVVITVTATLTGFDDSLTRASQSLGADSRKTFFKVQMPLILPGVISGALFAFITSFDEVVIVFFLAGFEQRTIPRQMWAGIREQISPTILAVATILVLVSILLLTTVELLRRRSEKLRGISPA
ncbi:MAG: ABC transporter permease [Pseudomonadota bacterium]|jgi:putative spermidine/putrescine transport system permease protein|nr:ABC transporter permease [Nisaea sp.]MEC7806515.1 ABC transporter permease [Pseudomonadota bacterium]MEC7972063.1 ABC transporter permease [Pseudomonadota bacterium]MEC9045497.1 ABC transporter permease [Pseudomonadota bacterium]MED5227096.1 ABC transporter permease [Pseudomonadota bacterium]|tara:strand:- start:313 stop:1164 length:852 start_codon:yes stop_codon:yes gene_type:complete